MGYCVHAKSAVAKCGNRSIALLVELYIVTVLFPSEAAKTFTADEHTADNTHTQPLVWVFPVLVPRSLPGVLVVPGKPAGSLVRDDDVSASCQQRLS